VVQLFQRYVPYSSVVDFVAQSLLCMAAFTLAVQVAFYLRLAPTLPALAGVRAGRTVTAVTVLVGVFYLTGYFERRNHLTVARFAPRLLQSVPLAAITLGVIYAFVPTIALPWPVAGAGLGLMTILMVAWHGVAPSIVRHEALAERVVIVGDGGLARQIAACTENPSPWGFRLAGYIPVGGTDDYERPPAPRLAEAQAPGTGPVLAAVAIALGPGESAAFVPKELGLEQLTGQRRTIHLHKRIARPTRVGVQRARHDFLANAAVTRDEYGHVGVGNATYELADGAHRLRSNDKAVVVVFRGGQNLHHDAIEILIEAIAREDADVRYSGSVPLASLANTTIGSACRTVRAAVISSMVRAPFPCSRTSRSAS